MDEMRIKGAANEMAGQVESAAGKLAGDAETEASGQVRQAKGAAQGMYGEATDSLRAFATEQPLTALLIAGGVGFLLGALIVRR